MPAPEWAKNSRRIYKYIKDRKGQRIGLLVAAKVGTIDAPVLIYWSLCNTKFDRFSEDQAWANLHRFHLSDYFYPGVPPRRALDYSYSETAIPKSIKKELDEFCHRAAKYFKVTNSLAPENTKKRYIAIPEYTWRMMLNTCCEPLTVIRAVDEAVEIEL